MLYKIEEQAEVFEKLEPVEFKDFSSFGKLEKDRVRPVIPTFNS